MAAIIVLDDETALTVSSLNDQDRLQFWQIIRELWSNPLYTPPLHDPVDDIRYLALTSCVIAWSLDHPTSPSKILVYVSTHFSQSHFEHA